MTLHIRFAVSLDFEKVYKLFCHQQVSDTFASKVFCCRKKQLASVSFHGSVLQRICKTQNLRGY